ncbi:MAG: hypothetical protein JXR58_00340 [Bacteroidales bacterium]|nr:hypothetical protein [Bacteroidales bacterium]
MLFLQPGIIKTENQFQKIQNKSSGIGGILRFYPWKFLTAGVCGGNQKSSYSSLNSTNSFISMGYGGGFAGCSIKTEKFRFTASFLVGKGRVKNLHIESQNQSVLNEAYLFQNSTMVYSPIISVDYFISKKILLCVQGVYLFAKAHNNKALTNPALQIGVLFNR